MNSPEIYKTGLIPINIDPLKTKEITAYLRYVCLTYRVNIEQQDDLSEDQQVQVILFSTTQADLQAPTRFIISGDSIPA